MTQLNYATLQVGQKVAVARYGSWNISSQGIYTVSKANKVRVTVTRGHDGYERTFLVKTKREMPHYEGGTPDDRSFLESVEDQLARVEQVRRAAELNGLWTDARNAAERKDLAALKTLMAKLEEATA